MTERSCLMRMLWSSAAALALLAGCSGGMPGKDGILAVEMQRDRKETAAASTGSPEKQPETGETGLPGTLAMATFAGTVQALHRGTREVTLRLRDGKVVRVRIVHGDHALTSLKPGNRVSFKLREAVEISQDLFFHPETGHIVERFPPGSMAERELFSPYYHRSPAGHHAANWSEVIEVPAKVLSVDLDSRAIRLITYDDRHLMVHVSDPQVDLAGFETGEPVVAHFGQIEELTVIESR